MMEAVIREVSVNIYQMIWFNFSEDNHLHNRHRENLKPHKTVLWLGKFGEF